MIELVKTELARKTYGARSFPGGLFFWTRFCWWKIPGFDTNLVVEGHHHLCSNLTLAWEAFQDSGQLWHNDRGDVVEMHKREEERGGVPGSICAPLVAFNPIRSLIVLLRKIPGGLYLGGHIFQGEWNYSVCTYVDIQHVCIHNREGIPTDALAPHERRPSVLSIETTRLRDRNVLDGVPDLW